MNGLALKPNDVERLHALATCNEPIVTTIKDELKREYTMINKYVLYPTANKMLQATQNVDVV